MGTCKGLLQPWAVWLGICSLLLLLVLLLLALAFVTLVQGTQELPSCWPAVAEESEMPVCKGAHAGLQNCTRLLLQLFKRRAMLGVLLRLALKMHQLACQPLQAIQGHAVSCQAEGPACLQDSQMRCTVHAIQLGPLQLT